MPNQNNQNIVVYNNGEPVKDATVKFFSVVEKEENRTVK